MSQIPEGFCQCGCGAPTRRHPKTIPSLGIIKGKPRRYLRGHHRRKTGTPYVVDPRTGCWIWQRSRTPYGYGHMWHLGRLCSAHRVFYENRFGPLPRGYVPDHLCQNPSCVNPDHLEAVTHAENIRRSSAAKLDSHKAQIIRNLAGHMSQERIAAIFGVSAHAIGQVILGKTWQPDQQRTKAVGSALETA